MSSFEVIPNRRAGCENSPPKNGLGVDVPLVPTATKFERKCRKANGHADFRGWVGSLAGVGRLCARGLCRAPAGLPVCNLCHFFDTCFVWLALVVRQSKFGSVFS